jgi:hypothetical protein
VLRASRERLNPLEVALVALADKTRALGEAVAAAARGPDRGAPQAFSQLLSGCVDAGVSGGLSNSEPFFSRAYETTHPEIAADLAAEAPPGSGRRPKAALLAHALPRALAAHAAALRAGTAVHARKCARDMLPLHEFLTTRLAELLAMLARWGVDVSEDGGGGGGGDDGAGARAGGDDA